MADRRSIRIAAVHRPALLRPVFERFGRLHVPDFLEAAAARRLAEALGGPLPWSRSLTVRGQSYDIPLPTLAAIPQARADELDDAVAEGGRSAFQYRFDTWRVSDAVDAGEPLEGAAAALEELYRFLDGPQFLGFARALTGDDRIAFSDAQATRYRTGDFLTAHDDDVAGKNRLYAYVLGFTPSWRIDWGGLLLVHAADGHVAEGYTPGFNSLNIFRVPQAHSVSQVASFVTAERLSVTGWLRRR